MASYAPAPSNPAALCDGDKLIVPQGAALPTNVCIKCGAPANAKPLKKTYYWHPSWVYLILIRPDREVPKGQTMELIHSLDALVEFQQLASA